MLPAARSSWQTAFIGCRTLSVVKIEQCQITWRDKSRRRVFWKGTSLTHDMWVLLSRSCFVDTSEMQMKFSTRGRNSADLPSKKDRPDSSRDTPRSQPFAMRLKWCWSKPPASSMDAEPLKEVLSNQLHIPCTASVTLIDFWPYSLIVSTVCAAESNVVDLVDTSGNGFGFFKAFVFCRSNARNAIKATRYRTAFCLEWPVSNWRGMFECRVLRR